MTDASHTLSPKLDQPEYLKALREFAAELR